MATSTCSLYGGANYANNWIGINVLVIMVSLAIVAFVYTLSRLLPERTRGRITEATRYEITQALLSALIIAILVGFAQVACTASASIGGVILRNAQVPSSQASLSPFQYADYYIGTLSQQQGLGLLTNLYTASTLFGVESHVFGSLGPVLTNVLSIVSPLAKTLFSGFGLSSGNIASFSIKPSLSFGALFNTLTWAYLTFYAPLTTLITGALFLQYILLPLLQFTAFIVLLPVAIAMRSLAFVGGNLKSSSNAVLALAIAGYLVYPLMVLFDSYIMYYLGVNPLTGAAICPPLNTCSTLNPNWAYLTATFSPPQLMPNSFLSQPITTPFGTPQNIAGLVSSAFNNVNFLVAPFSVVQYTGRIINSMALLAFQGIFLFAINLAITVGFAIGLAKALNSGVEGAGSFWANL